MERKLGYNVIGIVLNPSPDIDMDQRTIGGDGISKKEPILTFEDSQVAEQAFRDKGTPENFIQTVERFGMHRTHDPGVAVTVYAMLELARLS